MTLRSTTALRASAARRWKLVRARREALRLPGRPPSTRPLLLGLIGLVLVGLGAWVVAGTSVLGVRTVEVTGSLIASADQIRTVAGVAAGTPLARVDAGAVADRVRSLPSVASVAVHRSWPSTLRIEVTERVAVAVAPADTGFVLVDADGLIFHTVPARPAGVPLIKVGAPAPGDPTTRAALRVLAALTPGLRQVLEQLVADSATRIRLELTGGRVVVWGDGDHSDRKAQVATALLSRPAKTIDVSSPDVATTS